MKILNMGENRGGRRKEEGLGRERTWKSEEGQEQAR